VVSELDVERMPLEAREEASRKAAVSGRQIALYFAWSRPDEVAAPLGILEDRFPALFELRRLSWPWLEQFANPVEFDQGVGGFFGQHTASKFQTVCRPGGLMDRMLNAYPTLTYALSMRNF
jgi:hypothetical protein